MSPDRGTDVEMHAERLFDHAQRILTLETNAKVFEAELASLRSSRHEHSNWLNRHNLEVQELNLKVIGMMQQMASVVSKVDAMEKKFGELELSMEKKFSEFEISIMTQLANVKSDLRQTMWIVSLVVGVLVFVGRAIANKYGF